VLSSFGSVISKNPPISIPVSQGDGNSVEIEQNGATSLRLHFNAMPAATDATWRVEIRSPGDALLWVYTPVAGESTFWSNEVRGPRVKVRVISTQPQSPQQISVDGLAITKTKVKPRSIVGHDDREKITNQSDEVKALGKAVARIRFIGDDGLQYFCSGFLISTSLLMTNQHCPKSESEWRSALIDFDFDTPSANPKVTSFKQFVMSDESLDMAIFRLTFTPPGRSPLRLDGTLPHDNDALLLIEHPAGEPKQVSRIDCVASGIQLSGVTPNHTDFGHRCDTLGGSSGSTVVNPVTRTVVGLHHLGFLPTGPCINTTTTPDRCLVNRAVIMGQIIAFIKANRPDVSAELGLSP
jgi:V8-like Glu-specific endopeptidase